MNPHARLVGRLIGPSVVQSYNFLKGREVTHPCSYRRICLFREVPPPGAVLLPSEFAAPSASAAGARAR